MTALQAQYQTTTPAFRLTTAPTSGYTFGDTDPNGSGNRPLACYLQATTQNIRFTTDGLTTPTSSVGTLLVAGAAPFYYFGELNKLQFIQVTSGAVLNVIYAPLFDGPQGPPGSVDSVVAGAHISVDNSDPANPVVSGDGQVDLPITLAPNDVLADDGSNPLIGADANGNPYLQAYVGDVSKEKIGFDPDGVTTIFCTLGAEQISDAANRNFSSNTGDWTGTGWTIGSGAATHVAGANDLTLDNTALANAIAPFQTKYQITFTLVTTTPGNIYGSFGGEYIGRVTNFGTGVGTETVTLEIMATSSDPLVFTPDATWEGSFTSMSIKLLPFPSLRSYGGNVNGYPLTPLFLHPAGLNEDGAGYQGTTGAGCVVISPRKNLHEAMTFTYPSLVIEGQDEFAGDIVVRGAGHPQYFEAMISGGTLDSPTATVIGSLGRYQFVYAGYDGTNWAEIAGFSSYCIDNTPGAMRGEMSMGANGKYITINDHFGWTNAPFIVAAVAAPADADLAAGQMAIWFDSTNGAAKFMVKAKQADGTVKTGSFNVQT